MAAPPISARLTCGRSAIRWNSSWNGRVVFAAASILSGAEKRAEISARSAPPQKTARAERMCNTLQSPRDPRSSKMAWKLANISALKAFTGGRLSVTVAIRSATLRLIRLRIARLLGDRKWRPVKPAAPSSSLCTPPIRSIQAAADHKALDIVSSLVDLGAAHAAIDALHTEIFYVADATKRLDGVGTNLLGRLRREQLGHRCFGQAGPASVLERGGMQRELARGLEADRHIGKAEGDCLVLEDRLAEGFALMGIAHRNLERRPRHAYALGGDANATAFQVGKRNAVAPPLLTQQAVGGNGAIL